MGDEAAKNIVEPAYCVYLSKKTLPSLFKGVYDQQLINILTQLHAILSACQKNNYVLLLNY